MSEQDPKFNFSVTGEELRTIVHALEVNKQDWENLKGTISPPQFSDIETNESCYNECLDNLEKINRLIDRFKPYTTIGGNLEST